jgi:hypothetical protein
MILIKEILNLLKIKKPKIWRLSSIEVSFKYSKAKFKVGDEVLIKTRINTVDGFFKHGIILEVVLSPKLRGDSVDEWYYRVEYDPLEGRSSENHKYTDYFNESELDYTLQTKRDNKLRELGI